MKEKITAQMISDTETDPNEFLIFHKEIMSDMGRIRNIIKSSLNEIEPGVFITRCEQILFYIPTIPRTLQKSGRKEQKERIDKYKAYLREEFEKNKKILEIIKDKKILLYLISYLDKNHYKKYDVDNLPRHFCNVLKEFIGDDSNIQILISEKKEVDTKDIQSNLCEQFLVFIAHESFKEYLFTK